MPQCAFDRSLWNRVAFDLRTYADEGLQTEFSVRDGLQSADAMCFFWTWWAPDFLAGACQV